MMVRRQYLSREAGFTLIELLVVVAVVSILAAILFPAFSRARENGRRASCQSNLKQLGVMMLQYTQDNDEFYPLAWYGPASDSTATTPWVIPLQPYIKSGQILQCPSESAANGTIAALRPSRDHLGVPAIPLHYAYSIYIGGDSNYLPTEEYGVKKLSQIVNPSEVILMADAGAVPPYHPSGLGDGGGTDPTAWKELLEAEPTGAGNDPSRYTTAFCLVHGSSVNITPTSRSYATVAARHLGTANVLWADGHVKATQLGSIMKLDATADYRYPPTSCFNPLRGCSNVLGTTGQSGSNTS